MLKTDAQQEKPKNFVLKLPDDFVYDAIVINAQTKLGFFPAQLKPEKYQIPNDASMLSYRLV